MLQFQRCNTC